MIHPLRLLPILGAAGSMLLVACGGGGGGGDSGGNPNPPPAPQAQVIAFANIGPVNKTFGDAAFTNAASGGTGTGSITYASADPLVALVDAATGAVTIAAAGSAVITATKAADSTHLSAQSSYTVAIAKAPQVIAFGDAGPLTKRIGDAAFGNAAAGGASNVATSYASSNPAVAEVNSFSAFVTLVGAGTATITATRAADGNYLAAQTSYQLTVLPALVTAPPTFTQLGPVQKQFGDTPFVNLAGGGGTITYTSNTPAVATVDANTGLVTIVGAGSVQITASRAADPVYTAAQAQYALEVLRAGQVIAFAQPVSVNKMYGDAGFRNAASGGAGTGAITYSSSNLTVATVNANTGDVTIVGAGSSSIAAFKAQSANHFGAGDNYILTVAKAPQTVTFVQPGPVTRHTADGAYANLASAAGTGTITYTSDTLAVATVASTTGVASLVGAGETLITAFKAGDNNYLPAAGTYRLIVFASGTPLPFTGWVGTNDTEVQFPSLATGDQLLRASFTNCGSPLLSACVSPMSDLLGAGSLLDTVSRLNLTTQYWLRRSNQSYPAVQVSTTRLPPARNAQMVEFGGQLWMVGSATEASTWSSYDGRSWVKRATGLAFGPRANARAVAFANKLWLIGGYKTSGTTGDVSDVWSSADGITWTQTNAAAPFAPRDAHGLVAYNGKLWVVAGQKFGVGMAGVDASYNDVWSSADGVTWSLVTAAAPFSVRQPQLVVFTGRLWVVGGAEGRAPRSDAWSSLDGITWTQAGSAVILGTAEGLRAAVVGTRLYITGAAFSSMYTQQVFYTDTGNSWTGTGVAVPFERRIETALYSYQNRLWVYGGDTHDAYQDPSCCTRSDLWSSANGGIWTYEHTSAPYSPYRGQQLVEFGGKLWLLGPGRDGVSRAWSSENGDDWVNVPGANVLPQRVWPGVISFAGKLWMIGGLDGDTGNPASFKNDVWSSADGNTWTRVLANAPFTARYAHAVYVANGRLFVAGGVEGPPYVRPTDIWSTSDGVTWRQDLVSAPFGARVGHKVAALNGRLWLTGGSDELNQFPSDVWSSVDGINWRQDLVSDSRLRRYEHQLTAFNGRLWMTAGRDTTYAESRDLLSSADGVNWRTEAAPNWSARTSHAVAAFGTHLFLFGGEGATYDENRENEFWRTDDGVTWRLRHHNLIPVP